MSEHLTPEDRDRLSALAEKATPGPWIPHPRYVWTEDLGGIIQNWSADANAAADMEFIAAARAAVPALLDQLDQAEARINAVRELHSGSRLILGTPVFGCPECGEPNETEPCATIRALDGDR